MTQLEEIDQIIDDINAYRRKENFTELKNSAASLFELLKENKPVDDTWKHVDRYKCHYCGEIFLLYRYNDLYKFHTHIDEFNLIRHDHDSKTKCPKLVRCNTCSYTDDQCTEICERCKKEHYFCSCEQIVLLTRTDPHGNKLEVPPTV